jgi:seryl-tRNA synthetase
MPTIADAAKINNIPIPMLIEKISLQYPDRKWERTTELPAEFNLSALQKPAPEAIEHLQVEGKLTKQQATKILKAESLASAIVSAVQEVELAINYSEGQIEALELIAARNKGKASVLEAWQNDQLQGLEGRFNGIQTRMQALTVPAQDLLSAQVQAGEAGKDLLSQIREFTI